jgi:hypothetical protein
MLILALAGCSLIFPSNASGLGPTTGAPKRGECWDASNANAVVWVDWEGHKARPCSTSHDLYTYAIGMISGITSTTWASSTNPSQPSDAVQTKAENACTLKTLVPGLKWTEQLLRGYFFLPSKSAWADGARWVRCDAGVLAHGTTLAQQALVKLPASISTLVSEGSSDPLRFDYCIDSQVPAEGAGPLANDDFNLVADCRDDPEWRLAGRGTLPEAVGSPFPTAANGNADAQKVCSTFAATAGDTWYAYLPPETSDATVGTNREITCWVGKLETNDSGGAA